jgi:tRNA threonylcarbamoyladenosine biosynthesis protein TsaB
MLILGLETTTPLASVALWSDAGLLGEVAFRGPRTVAQRLVLTLEHLLATVDCAVEEIGAIAVSRGPGSFTSVRVGLATAKGLAQGLGCPLIGVPTLEVLARPAAIHPGFLCPVIPAPKRNVYAAVYAWEGEGRGRKGTEGDGRQLGNWETGKLGCEAGSQPPEPNFLISQFPSATSGTLGTSFHSPFTEVVAADLMGVEDLAARLVGLSAPVVVCGEMAPELRAVLEAAVGASLLWAPPSLATPRAAVVAELGWLRWQAGDVDDALTLAPLYLRPSEPEERFGQQLCQV